MRVVRIVCIPLMLFLVACSRESEVERAYNERIEQERRQREQQAKLTADGLTQSEAAIRLVQESPAEQFASVAEWVSARTSAETGNILFPRWQARRRGVGRFEVMFTYTLLEKGGGAIVKKGFAWHADLVLKIVNGPRELAPEEMPGTSSRYRVSRGQHPVPDSSEVESLRE